MKGKKSLIVFIFVAGLAINSLFMTLTIVEERQNEAEARLKPWVAEQQIKTIWCAETVLAYLINPVGLALGIPVGWGTRGFIKRVIWPTKPGNQRND